MNTVRCLRITKRPRTTPLLDIPIRFPHLQNLHLELIEVKDKLKPGLPLIPRSQPKLSQGIQASEKQKEEKQGPINTENDSDEHNDNTSPKEHKKHKHDRRDKSDKHNKHDKHDKHKKHHRSHKHTQSTSDTHSITTSHTHHTDKTKRKNKDKNVKDAITDALGDYSDAASGTVNGNKSNLSDIEDIEDDGIIAKSGSESFTGTADGETEISGGIDDDGTDVSIEATDESGGDGNNNEEFDIYAGLSPEEREIKEKEEYLWRFRIMRKKFGRNPTVPIPEYNEHSDLKTMKSSYERTLKELYLDDAVESYKTYLVGGWIVIEYVCTQLIGIDLRGFTLQQTKMMYKYESMLIELGEKSTSKFSNIPVELKLIGTILFQAAIFYLAKIISDKLGSNVAELFSSFTGQPLQNNGSGGDEEEEDEEEKPKRRGRMKGPTKKAEDIRQNT